MKEVVDKGDFFGMMWGMKIKGMSFKPNRGPSYLATFENTRAGRASFKKVAALFRDMGNNVRRYGRGPRRSIFERLAKDPSAPEYGRQWTRWQNNHYRPRIGVCTHWDAYIYRKEKS